MFGGFICNDLHRRIRSCSIIITWVGIRYKLTRFHSDHSKGHITSFKLTVHISTFLEPITEHELAIVTGLIKKFTLGLCSWPLVCFRTGL